ncbi:metallophosphoesterase [Myxococcota bacterium]|nr:metallophosphoesterase [Myxococcota bacterium]
MLIASVSDIHTDFPENREAVVRLATEIHARSADVVVVAGDVSHKNDRIERALRAFREVCGTVVYLPGNHDLWFDVPYAPARSDLDTWQRYHVELKALAESAGAHYLPAAPLVRDGVAIAGSCGWYDYSLAAPWVVETVGAQALAAKELAGLAWSDARYVAFRRPDGALMPDAEVARVMERELEAQLVALDAASDVRDVVVATHHQAFYDVVTRHGTLPWDFFNAFMGSRGLGDVILRCPKVRTVIYGHTHTVGEHRVGPLRVYGTPLGYPRERRGLGEDEVARTRIGWIEL